MRLLLFVLLALTANLSFSQGYDTAVAGHPADQAAIHKTMDAFVSAWNIHDATAFAAAFSADADFTNVRGDFAHGRAAIDSFHVPIFKGRFKNSHQTMPQVKIRFLALDLAMVDAHWEMTGDISPATGQVIPLRKGLLSFVMKKAGTDWLILVMHNTDLPLN